MRDLKRSLKFKIFIVAIVQFHRAISQSCNLQPRPAKSFFFTCVTVYTTRLYESE